jgi:hypothetical protein
MVSALYSFSQPFEVVGTSAPGAASSSQALTGRAIYPPIGRTVKHVKIQSSLDLFVKSLALALARNI